MAITENTLLAALLKKLRQQCSPSRSVIIKHADDVTSGVPDVSVTMNGLTTWWEFKHAKPYIKWRNELQQVTCCRLGSAGHCYVVIYETVKRRGQPIDLRVCITYPEHVLNGPVKGMLLLDTPGHDHQSVIDFIKKTHRTP